MVRDAGRPIIVVTCGGGSALGTLAAVRWAVDELRQSVLVLGNGPLPTPPDIKESSRLEALIRVSADITEDAWQPKQIELCKLLAGRHRWCSETLTWQPSTKPQIVLLTAGASGEVVEVWFDGQHLPMRPDGAAFKQLVALCDLVLESGDGTLDPAELGQRAERWGQDPVPEKTVRRQLASLKNRYLHGCLELPPHRRASLHAEVVKRPK
jgi:hypothetical protein